MKLKHDIKAISFNVYAIITVIYIVQLSFRIQTNCSISLLHFQNFLVLWFSLFPILSNFSMLNFLFDTEKKVFLTKKTNWKSQWHLEKDMKTTKRFSCRMQCLSVPSYKWKKKFSMKSAQNNKETLEKSETLSCLLSIKIRVSWWFNVLRHKNRWWCHQNNNKTQIDAHLRSFHLQFNSNK